MSYKTIKTNYGDKYTFFIKHIGSEFVLFVEPEFRNNGTQNFDGYFPRTYSHPKYAKAALTKYLGKPNPWVEVKLTLNKVTEALVKFWHQEEENGFLSNLFDAPIEIDDVIWPTSEHYYQAMKHIDPVVIAKVRRQKKALNSKFVSRQACKRLDRWPSDEHKLSSMRIAIKAKFDQHTILRGKLLKTAPLTIIENSPKDSYWGVGIDGEGKNMMGILLMELRDFYMTKQQDKVLL